MLERLREFLIAVCVTLGVPGCVGGAFAASGYVWQGDGVRLVFTTNTCTNAPILERVKPEFRKSFRAGVAHFDGASVPICWLEKDGVIHFIADEGGPAAVGIDDPRTKKSEPI